MQPVRLIRFGPYELDVRSGELRKFGIRIKLREQPVLKILTLLLENAGEVVLREQIRDLLWPNDTVVEFDHGINVAIRKLRDALGETAEDPRYVETVASRGYRFIGPIEPAGIRVASREAPAIPATVEVSRTRARSVWIGGAALAVMAAFFAGTRFREKPVSPAVVRFSVSPPEDTTLEECARSTTRHRTDGSWFSSPWRSTDIATWLRTLAMAEAKPLSGADGGSLPFWSPNSRSIAFFAADGKLKRIDLDSASGPDAPRVLCDSASYAGGTWNRDGVILFASGTGVLHRVSDAGGSPVPATRIDEARHEISHRYPWVRPDGRQFLSAANDSSAPANHGTIRVGSLDSWESKILLEADSNAIFVEGRLLFVRGGESWWRSRSIPSTWTLTGEAVPVTERRWRCSTVWETSPASAAGPLVYAPERGAILSSWYLSTVPASVLATLGDAVNPGFYLSNPEISPDGKTVAVVHFDANNQDIWLYGTAGGSRARFTFDPAKEVSPVWSPAGKDIAFASSRRGRFDIYRKAFDGSGPEELLYADGDDKYPTSWSPDGRFLLFDRHSEKSPAWSVWVLPLGAAQNGEARKPFPLLPAPLGGCHAGFSPDGRWIDYQLQEGGLFNLFMLRDSVGRRKR